MGRAPLAPSFQLALKPQIGAVFLINAAATLDMSIPNNRPGGQASRANASFRYLPILQNPDYVHLGLRRHHPQGRDELGSMDTPWYPFPESCRLVDPSGFLQLQQRSFSLHLA